ncbi:MAG: Hsp20/alpha crystallin family protein [Candidatus Pacebacteria bacterium]|nr:Hsp20/alpha crystallin family protein [Candidatus Paceibacterota bacterium]MDD4074125.1 Hsp20/alpha crystallin family protein [Candidatus Paceibacterota bacterium]
MNETKNWDSPKGQLIVDVYETEKEIVVQSAIAGVTNNEIDVSLEGDILVIKGERKNPSTDEKRKYFLEECYWGPFSKEIILPREIDTGRIDAKIKDGILTVRMQKIERAKNKKISID